MEGYALRVIDKIIVLFIAMIAGFIAKKGRIIDVHSTKALSSLLVYITCPALIVCSLQIDYNVDTLIQAGLVFVLSLIVHSSLAIGSHFIFKIIGDKKRRGVYEYAFTYHNCAYMGYPIMLAVFGDVGLFYGVIFVTAFNLFNWSHGLIVMSGKNGLTLKAIVKNPALMSVFLSVILFLLRIKLPTVLYDGLDLVGDMTFPLAMVIIGSLLAGMKFKEIFGKKDVYLFSLLFLIITPAIMLFFGKVLGLPEYLAITGITMCACPVAANTAVTAEVYDNDSNLAAKLVGVTTLFCLITIPLMLLLTQIVL